MESMTIDHDLSYAEAQLRIRLNFIQRYGPLDLTTSERQQVDAATLFETELVQGERVILIDRRKQRGSRS